MPPEVRQSLISALLKHLPEPSSPVVLVARPDQPRPTPIRTNGHRPSVSVHAYNPSVALILEISTILASRDAVSMDLLGESIADALQNIVRDAANVHTLVLSRAVFYLMHLMNASQVWQDHSLFKTPVILHTISGFDQVVLEQVAQSVLRGLSLCIQQRTPLKHEIINSPDFWLILKSLHLVQSAAQAVFDIVQSIVTSEATAVSADNFVAIVSLLDDFATAGSIGATLEQQSTRRQPPPPQREKRSQRQAEPATDTTSLYDKEVVIRGYKAVVLTSQLIQRVPKMIEQSHLEVEEAWMTYWSLIFQKLQAQCLNPCRKIRRQACSSLQHALLSPHLSPASDEQWGLIFRTVLFGLITRLLKPEVYQTDPIGMNETRLQAANLLCRTFLHHLPLLSQRDDLLELWLRILDVMDRLMHSGQGDSLEEAVPESLKNILLVMADSGVLLTPQPGDQSSELFAETRKRVDRFLPHLINEIFPQAIEPQKEALDPAPDADASSTAPSISQGGHHGDVGSKAPPASDEGSEEAEIESHQEKSTRC